jgi:hypothetical protein
MEVPSSDNGLATFSQFPVTKKNGRHSRNPATGTPLRVDPDDVSNDATSAHFTAHCHIQSKTLKRALVFSRRRTLDIFFIGCLANAFFCIILVFGILRQSGLTATTTTLEDERIGALRMPFLIKNQTLQKELYNASMAVDSGPLAVDTVVESFVISSGRTSDRAFNQIMQVTERFSACILFMDDNPRLVEWLAYHFFALNLREVVVAVDPRSKSSPWQSLERWTPYMNITVWNDTDFGFVVDQYITVNGTRKQKIDVHRGRQKFFYGKCIKYLQGRNRTWTAFHDIDEYITVDERVVFDAKERSSKPGSVLQMLQEVKSMKPVPDGWTESCVPVPRCRFSAVESQPEEVSLEVPPLIDAKQLETLRWRYRSLKGRDGQPKSIVDISEVTLHRNTKFGPHAVILGICPPHLFDRSFLVINHYLGDWDMYSFRDDCRIGSMKNREAWEFRSSESEGGTTDQIRPWIGGFVAAMGEERALQLLKDVGLPKNYTNPYNKTEWRIEQSTLDALLKKRPRRATNYVKFLEQRIRQSNINHSTHYN